MKVWAGRTCLTHWSVKITFLMELQWGDGCRDWGGSDLYFVILEIMSGMSTYMGSGSTLYWI